MYRYSVDNKIRINRIVIVLKSFLEPWRQIETNIAKNDAPIKGFQDC